MWLDQPVKILNSFIQACVEFSDIIYYRSTSKPYMDSVSNTTNSSANQKILDKVYNLKAAGELDDAMVELKKALEDTSPGSEEYFPLSYEIGNVLLLQEKVGDAIKEYEGLWNYYPEKIVTPFRIADVYSKIDQDKAISVFKEIYDRFYRSDFDYSLAHDEDKSIIYRTPLKLSYLQWRSGKIIDAINTVERANEILGKDLPEGVTSEYTNSEIYFKIEALENRDIYQNVNISWTYDDLLKQFEDQVIKGRKLNALNLSALDTYAVLSLRVDRDPKQLRVLIRAIRSAIRPDPDKEGGYEGRKEKQWKALPRNDYDLTQRHIYQVETKLKEM